MLIMKFSGDFCIIPFDIWLFSMTFNDKQFDTLNSSVALYCSNVKQTKMSQLIYGKEMRLA